MKHLIFIGPLGGGSVPTNGASVKNYHLLASLKQYYESILVIDTECWKRKPFVIVKLLITILRYSNSVYILSLNSMSAYRILRFLKGLSIKRKIYYWVIGGSLANWIQEGRVKLAPYFMANMIVVEGDSMKRDLLKCGFMNVICIPNFKHISYLPKKSLENKGIRKFVFLSRILPAKGCDYIIDAVQKLNGEYESCYVVDFYGVIDESYKDDFMGKIDSVSNISYMDFLDLRCVKNYDILCNYDVMLFPTYWRGEGFPGIVIDAYIAGLPIVATDWHLNKDIVKNEETGFLIPPHDVSTLIDAMRKFITMEETKLLMFSERCQQEVANYDVNNVLSQNRLREIGLIE